MRYIVAVILLYAPLCWAGHKIEVEVVSGNQSTETYDVPARAICLPGAYGPTCGARGAGTVDVDYVTLNAKINGVDVTLTCNTARKKHCSFFQAGKYPAEEKGKDEVILYGWSNPMYFGDFSKANKITFKISAP
jgi:hypothetical protein